MQQTGISVVRRVMALTAAFLGLAVWNVGETLAAEPFYKDKRIIIMCSGSGSYDAYARLVAKYLGRHIPGNPSLIVKTLRGASGVRAANYMFNKAPRDGTEIAATHGQIPTSPLYLKQGIQYDPTELGWIGSVTKETFIAVAWKDSPVKSMAEAMNTEALFGGQTVGAMSVDMAILSNAMAGTKFKIVTGYKGSEGARLAVERGELHGVFGTALNSLRSSRPDWFNEKKIVLLTQFGFKKHSDLSEVPLFIDLVKNDLDRAAVELYIARAETGKPYFAPPGIPAERLELLRAAFDKMVRDPDFLAEIEKRKFDMREPMSGAEIETFVKRMAATPQAAVDRLNEVIANYAARQ